MRLAKVLHAFESVCWSSFRELCLTIALYRCSSLLLDVKTVKILAGSCLDGNYLRFLRLLGICAGSSRYLWRAAAVMELDVMELDTTRGSVASNLLGALISCVSCSNLFGTQEVTVSVHAADGLHGHEGRALKMAITLSMRL